jgi:hypothetical protein
MDPIKSVIAWYNRRHPVDIYSLGDLRRTLLELQNPEIGERYTDVHQLEHGLGLDPRILGKSIAVSDERFIDAAYNGIEAQKATISPSGTARDSKEAKKEMDEERFYPVIREHDKMEKFSEEFANSMDLFYQMALMELDYTFKKSKHKDNKALYRKLEEALKYPGAKYQWDRQRGSFVDAGKPDVELEIPRLISSPYAN